MSTLPEIFGQATDSMIRAEWLAKAEAQALNRYNESIGGCIYLHTDILFALPRDNDKALKLQLPGGQDIVLFGKRAGLGKALADAINEVLMAWEQAGPEVPAPEVPLSEAIDDDIPF
jgi:hypothetical protein